MASCGTHVCSVSASTRTRAISGANDSVPCSTFRFLVRVRCSGSAFLVRGSRVAFRVRSSIDGTEREHEHESTQIRSPRWTVPTNANPEHGNMEHRTGTVNTTPELGTGTRNRNSELELGTGTRN